MKIEDIRNRGAKTERLYLRKLEVSDSEDMFEYTKEEETCKFLSWGPHAEKIEAESFIKKVIENYAFATDLLWGIELCSERKLIGVIRLYNIDYAEGSADISYIQNSKFCKKGYMTEAVLCIFNICFDQLNLRKINAYCVKNNYLSEQVMQRCGMLKEENYKALENIKGEMVEFIKYSCRREQAE